MTDQEYLITLVEDCRTMIDILQRTKVWTGPRIRSRHKSRKKVRNQKHRGRGRRRGRDADRE